MKVAIYCRLSEEDRNKHNETDDSESIQNQKSMLVNYACEKGWDIFNIYSDDDFTGADRNRPAFNQLLLDAEAHKFDIVLCKTQSRFTRELEMVEKYIHGLFIEWNIRFVSIVDNADTSIKGNKKSRQINGLVNEWYLEDMSENIKGVFNDKRKNGVHIGSFALYGYVKDPDVKGHLIIDEEAAAVVREIFTLFAQGNGKTSIAKRLNDRGIPNPTEYKRLHGLRYKAAITKNSKLWRYYAIADMLTNEIYIGNMVQGKYGSISYKSKKNKPRPKEEWFIKEGTHEPIIDRELWDRVQALIKSRTKPFSTGTDTGKVGIFAKKVKCIGCGYYLRSYKSRGKHYLQCTNHFVSKDSCIGAFIAVDTLEKRVISEFNQLTQDYLEVRDNQDISESIRLNNDLANRKAKVSKEISSYQKKVAEYTKGVQELYLDKVKGIISEADYFQMSKDFSSERARLEGLIKEANIQIESIEDKIQSDADRRTLVLKYYNKEHLSREAVMALIDYIEVGKRIPGRRDRPIVIHWNF